MQTEITFLPTHYLKRVLSGTSEQQHRVMSLINIILKAYWYHILLFVQWGNRKRLDRCSKTVVFAWTQRLQVHMREGRPPRCGKRERIRGMRPEFSQLFRKKSMKIIYVSVGLVSPAENDVDKTVAMGKKITDN